MERKFGVSFSANGKYYQFMTSISAKYLSGSSIDLEINKVVMDYKSLKNITSEIDENSIVYAEN